MIILRLDDSDLESVCEYADICHESNYGNKDECYNKEDCKTYWKNVDVEMKMWTWYQIESEDETHEKKND